MPAPVLFTARRPDSVTVQIVQRIREFSEHTVLAENTDPETASTGTRFTYAPSDPISLAGFTRRAVSGPVLQDLPKSQSHPYGER